MRALSMNDGIGIVPALVYSLCSFVANAGVAVTGFGMALIFVFVYTLFDVFGKMTDCHPIELCDMKYAVCLQSLSLVGSMPFLLYKSNALQHANRHLLYTLIPVTLVSTPFGQYCQDYVPSSWIRMVVGIVVTLVVGYEIYKLCHAKTTSDDEETTALNEQTPLLTEKDRTLSPEDEAATGTDMRNDSDDDQLHGFSRTSIGLWGVILGFFSGFLGGLIGMRGPPLMIFFLQFPFPKYEARAVGAVLLFLNMALRMLYYMLQDYFFTESGAVHAATVKWFYWHSSWHLYVGVVLAGVLGVPIGDWVHHRIDQSKFRFALAVILAASGIVNMVKAIAELRQTQ